MPRQDRAASPGTANPGVPPLGSPAVGGAAAQGPAAVCVGESMAVLLPDRPGPLESVERFSLSAGGPSRTWRAR